MKRSNEKHASITDPEASRKGQGKEAKLCFIGHGLMENRSGLLVSTYLTQADGHAERVAALSMVEPHVNRPRRVTLGGNKNYDVEDFGPVWAPIFVERVWVTSGSAGSANAWSARDRSSRSSGDVLAGDFQAGAVVLAMRVIVGAATRRARRYPRRPRTWSGSILWGSSLRLADQRSRSRTRGPQPPPPV